MKLLFLCAATALAVPRIELDLSAALSDGVRPTKSTDWGNDGHGGKATNYADPKSELTGEHRQPGVPQESTLTLSNGEKWNGAEAPQVFKGTNPSKATGIMRLRKLAEPITRSHDQGYMQPTGDKVGSRQDYTQRCNAGPTTGFSNCPFPVAKAYDQQDKDISSRIVTRVFRVDFDGMACKNTGAAATACGCTGGSSKSCEVTAVKFNERSTYLFKYDVKDNAGNHAEQVVFALIIDDNEKPKITLCEAADKTNGKCKWAAKAEDCVPMGCHRETVPRGETTSAKAEAVEAASSWTLCSDYQVADNVDDNLKASILFDLQKKEQGWTTLVQDAQYDAVKQLIDVNQAQAEYLITMKVCDNAGVYGQNSMSNCIQVEKGIKILDTTHPVIVLHGELGNDRISQNGDADETLTKFSEFPHEYTAPIHECNFKMCKHNLFNDEDHACNAALPRQCSEQFRESLNLMNAHRSGADAKHINNAIHERTANGSECDWEAFENYCNANAGHCVGYEDPGSSVIDSLDTFALSQRINAQTHGTVDDSTTGNYQIKYTAQDSVPNTATIKIRHVEVKDRTPPVITLNAMANGAVVHTGDDFTDPGAQCWDMCDTTTRGAAVATWVVCPGGKNAGSTEFKADRDASKNQGFDSKAFMGRFMEDGSPAPKIGECYKTFTNKVPEVTGTYIRLYQCTDKSGNINWATRKWTVEDNKVPTLMLLGDAEETYDASKTVEYTDKGATCMDSVDGTLSSAVEVSGEVVNMKKVGDYVLRYDCQDSAGNVAKPLFRTVNIEDKSCPEVTMLGSQVNYVEAGYAWVDPGATCKDDLDDQCTVRVEGDTVNTGGAFYERSSCKDILLNYCHEQHVAKNEQLTFTHNPMEDARAVFAGCKGPSNGNYYITRKGARRQVYCHFFAETAITSKKCANCARDGSDCASWGLEKYASSWADSIMSNKYGSEYVEAAAQGNTKDTYVCSTNDQAVVPADMEELISKWDTANLPSDSTITHAEVGKYIISYHATDNVGNIECEPKFRTVIVRDTLPPVISLHLKAKTNAETVNDAARKGKAYQADGYSLIHMGPSNGQHQGKDYHRSHASIANPKYNTMAKTNNPNRFMAEQTATTNAWFVLAAASAVAGLALVAFSRKQQPVAVEV